LSEKLSETGADVLLNALDLIEKGRAVFTKQDDREASCAPKLKKSDGLIDWREPAVRIHDRVRGLLPWPGAFTRFDGGILKILKTRLIGSPDTGKAACGEILGIVKGEGIAVKTGTGSLLITHLQLEGRKALDADSFLRGHRLSIGQRIEE
jgi:methionyl-tRNA formyltransferase